MKIALTGSSGLIGRRLSTLLGEEGHEVWRLVRSAPVSQNHEVYWNPATREIDAKKLAGLDAVVHLAGENVASGRWSAARKAAIRDSRVEGTRILCEAVAGLEARPRAVVCASAIGYYGDRGDQELTEQSAAGQGFLAEVCRDWEQACKPAADAGIRVVNLRIGVVLAPDGGALSRMLLPFRLGLGGVVGSGKQYVSWITIEDAARAAYHCLTDEALAGPVNAVAPSPATNRELTKTLGRVLRRPTLFPLPSAMVRLAFGEMGPTLLLASAKVLPKRLLNAGFAFGHADLEPALRAVLGVPPA